MRKITAIALCLVLALSFAGCGERNDIKAKEKEYSITYDLGALSDDFIFTPSSAKPGDTVEIRTQILYDADIHVFVDGSEIEKSHYDSDYWGYSFTMPDNDASVTAKPYTKSEIWGTGTDEPAALREKYPEYFGLDTMKGLEVYVWQIVPNSYSFGVLSGTNRSKELEELMNMKGASASEMKAILSTYDIDESWIAVIPWQNPVSSYIPEFWIRFNDEDPDETAKRQKEYVDGIRKMLFDDPGAAS